MLVHCVFMLEQDMPYMWSTAKKTFSLPCCLGTSNHRPQPAGLGSKNVPIVVMPSSAEELHQSQS